MGALTWLWRRVELYPARVAGLFRAAVVLGAAFGFQLSATQTAGCYLFAEALLTFLTENATTSNPTAQAQIHAALLQTPPAQ